MTERLMLLKAVCFAEKRLIGQIKEQEGDLHLFIRSARGSSYYRCFECSPHAGSATSGTKLLPELAIES